MTPKEALDLVFRDPDSDEDMTIRAYFKMQLRTLWEEGESFSGKRPFGNSGWAHNLAIPLIMTGCISGKVSIYYYDEDEDDHVYITADEAYLHEGVAYEAEGINDREYDKFVAKMIDAL